MSKHIKSSTENYGYSNELFSSLPLHFSDSPLDLSENSYSPIHSLKCTVNGIDINLPSSGHYFHESGNLIASDGISQTIFVIPSASEYLKTVKNPTSGEYSLAFCDKYGKEFIPETKAGETLKTNIATNVLTDIPDNQWDLEKIHNSTNGSAAFKIVRGVDDIYGGAPAVLVPTSENYLSGLYPAETALARLGSTHVTIEQQEGVARVEYYNITGQGVFSETLESPVRKAFDNDTKQELIREGNLHPLYLVVQDNKVAFSSKENAQDLHLVEDELMISWLHTIVEFPEDKSSFKLMLTPGDNGIGNRLPFTVTSMDPHAKVINPEDATRNSELFLDMNDLTITLSYMNTLTAVNSYLQWSEHMTGKITPKLFRLEASREPGSSDISFQLTCENDKHRTMKVETSEFGQIIQRSLFKEAGLLPHHTSPPIEDPYNTEVQQRDDYEDKGNRSDEKYGSESKESDSDITSEKVPLIEAQNNTTNSQPIPSGATIVDKLHNDTTPSSHFDLVQWNSNSQHKMYLNDHLNPGHPENYPLWIRATYEDIRLFHSNLGAKYMSQEITYEKTMLLYEKIISSSRNSENFMVDEGSVDANGNVIIGGHNYGSLESMEKMFTSSEQ